jgi:hypothetical protein
VAEAPPAPVVVAVVVVETAFVALDWVIALVVAVLAVLPAWAPPVAVCVVDTAPLVTVAVPVEASAALFDVIEPSVPETVLGSPSPSFAEQAARVSQHAPAKHRHRRSF